MAEVLLTPRDLLAARLRQMLWVERLLAEQVLPELFEEAHATDLKHGFGRHLRETEAHAATVREILEELEVPARPEESPALQGLVEEHEQLVAQIPGENHLLEDLAHVQAAAATEHLEMAAYDSLSGLAEALGEESIAIRLRELMEQEELALELVGRSQAKLLAEKVESERL
jgi:ferritin-like metal-binding protein YciE